MKATNIVADPLDRVRYPLDPWRLFETYPDLSDLGTTETLFSVGNGYLGIRGNPEEGRDYVVNGTFINGFHETWTIKHAEEAYGFARTGQTIVNVPDAKTIKLYVDDEPLLIGESDLEFYERSLDFRDGLLRRELIWRTPSGKRVRVCSTRMVSFAERHLALMSMEITMLTGEASIVVSSQILNRQDGVDEYNVRAAGSPGFDPRRAGGFDHRVLIPQGDWHSARRMLLGYRAANSGMTLAVGADHTITPVEGLDDLVGTEPDLGRRVFRWHGVSDEPVTITKAAVYHTADGIPNRELFDRCRRTLDRVRHMGVEYYYDEQRAWLDEYWANSDVAIADHPAIQQAVRWCLFQLAQSAARADQLGIPAKGVSGNGYEGHYFWDSEIYLVPFLCYTNPEIARNVLRFRWNLLLPARARAAELSEHGALFAWRTINGEEASAYYAAGTAQYHIDADIAFAFSKYAELTADADFMGRYGVDVLVETARMWADMGFWRPGAGGPTFQIHGVTGPDEYTTVVNNNLFTNVMARANLLSATAVVRRLRVDDPVAYLRMVDRLDVSETELDEWERCARGMFIPYDKRLGLHPQDDQFLGHEMWNLENTPADHFPLLLHYHPLVIYRFQVLKQADVVLAEFLQGDQFSAEEKRADFDYYDRITTGDSTLSAVVQSIAAAEIGYHDLAMSYFLSGLFVDLADLHNNTTDGVHVASTGGVWNTLVYGFAGLRDYRGEISFDPRLPADWPELAFPLRVRGTKIRVTLRPDRLELEGVEGPDLELSVRGERYRVSAGASLTVPLADQGPRLSS